MAKTAALAGHSRTVSPSIRRIVVISKMTFGDFVLVLPFLAELRRRHPAARITMVCGRRGSSLCALYPQVDEVLNLGLLRPGRAFLRTSARLLTLLRSDLVYALHPLLFSGAMAFFIRGRSRIGFSQATTRLYAGPPDGFVERPGVSRVGEWLLRRILLTDSRPMRTHDAHAAKRFLQLFGSPANVDGEPTLRGQLSTLYPRTSSTRPRIILAPFSGWTPRNWPLDRWVELARKLCAADPARQIVVSVDPSSAVAAQTAFAPLPEAKIFVPAEDFDHLFRTFAGAALVVSNDSFPLHAASALNVPSVGLFGPNIPLWFGGLAETHDDLFSPIECNPCVQRAGHEPCLRGLATCAALDAWSVEAVTARCLAVLAASARRAG